ncbi:MAG: hypothetical protein HC904_12625 [Blastochloris sp.]|nr:hypothetical protein [Blastochloris sp.]
MVEFAILFTVLTLITMGVIEFARVVSLSLRLASSVREAGRIVVAQEITPDPTLDDDENEEQLTKRLNGQVYTAVKNMVAPADLPNRGRLIFTFISRQRDNTTGSTDHPIIIDMKRSISFGATGMPGSKIPYDEGTLNGAPVWRVRESFIDQDSLKIGEKTVIVEIYHKTDFNPALQGLLEVMNIQTLYDRAMFKFKNKDTGVTMRNSTFNQRTVRSSSVGRKGQIMVLFVLLLPLMFAMAGLAIDTALMFRTKSILSRTSDALALRLVRKYEATSAGRQRVAESIIRTNMPSQFNTITWNDDGGGGG